MEVSWDQATEAAQQQNWATLDRYLEQLLDQPPALIVGTGLDRSLALSFQVLETGDFQARWDVSKLISGFGTLAIAPLTDLLQNPAADLEAQWFAARILGGLGDARAIAVLVETVKTTEDDELGVIAAEALANLGAEAIAALTQLLADAETRELAVRALAQIRRSDTIAPLLSVVQDANPALRTLAIDALSSFHDAQIPPALVQALTDPDAAVRRSAIAGLAMRSDLAAELDLVHLLGDRLWDLDLSVGQQAALALGRMGTAALDILLQALHSPNTPLPLQLEIVRSLSWTESQAGLTALQQALAGKSFDRAVHLEIVKLLGRWTTPELQPQAAATLIERLSHPTDPQTQQEIALALGQLRQPEATDPLIHLLAQPDPRTRLHTIAALKTLPQAHAQLQSLSHRSDLPKSLHEGITIALTEWQ